jgi:hypothetical protein
LIGHGASSPTESRSFETLLRERAKEKFEFPGKWGIDLQSEHERFLTGKHAKKPVIVMNYPKDIKASYMRVNDDGRTAVAMGHPLPDPPPLAGEGRVGAWCSWSMPRSAILSSAGRARPVALQGQDNVRQNSLPSPC